MESNHRPPGSEPGVTTSSNCPGMVAFVHSQSSSGRGIRTPIAWFKAKQRTVGPSPDAGRSPWARGQTNRASAPMTESALRESNPRSRFGRPAPVPFGQEHASNVQHRTIRSKRKERESNPQGREARPFSRRLPSPVVGLPFRFVILLRELRRQESNLQIISLTRRRLTVWLHRSEVAGRVPHG